MPRYRCFCLDGSNRILWGTFVEAKDLSGAIIKAHAACQEHFKTTKSRVQIWQGAKLLHTSPKRFRPST